LHPAESRGLFAAQQGELCRAYDGRNGQTDRRIQIRKKCIELSGSDPFVILADADLDLAIKTGVRALYQNTAQSCIAAKWFIVVEPVLQELEDFGG
jgi:hypothetical protein